MNKIKIASLLLLSSMILSSCASEWEAEPIGIGSDPSELKRSPCACMPLDFERAIPDWMIEQTV